MVSEKKKKGFSLIPILKKTDSNIIHPRISAVYNDYKNDELSKRVDNKIMNDILNLIDGNTIPYKEFHQIFLELCRVGDVRFIDMLLKEKVCYRYHSTNKSDQLFLEDLFTYFYTAYSNENYAVILIMIPYFYFSERSINHFFQKLIDKINIDMCDSLEKKRHILESIKEMKDEFKNYFPNSCNDYRGYINFKQRNRLHFRKPK